MMMKLDAKRMETVGKAKHWCIVAGMKRGLAMVCAAGLIECACQNMPGPYAPPVQRQPLEDFRPYRMSAVVNMSDEDAKQHFVKDITWLDAGSWRWTGKRPTVQVRVRSVDKLRYTIDFAIVEATLRTTGPVTISFLVNDRVLDRVKYPHAGSQHFEKTIPAGWITAEQDVTVGAEVDKLWLSPGGGPELGIILVRMGLTQ